MLSRKTFGKALDAHHGLGQGFDLLRLALALSIMANHCSSVSGTKGFLSAFLQGLIEAVWPMAGDIAAQQSAPAATVVKAADSEAISGLARPFTLSHVPMFFALSGFLVMGSAFRTRKVLPFLTLRVFRILPALIVEVTLSAVVLGAFFTTLPLKDYYTSAGFWAYFLNIIGYLHLFLPGVSFNGQVIVNVNLWTLPSEFYCYLLAAGLIMSGLLFNRRLFSAMFVVATVALIVANSFYGLHDTMSTLPGSVNVYYFFMGAMFYMWRDRVVYSPWIFAAAVVLTYVMMFSNRLVYVYPALLAYITMFIGLSALPKIPLLQSGDYSYGIYLYGFPITITLAAAIPALQNNLFGLLISSIVCTGLFAALSWHMIEKPFLRLKKYVSPRQVRSVEDAQLPIAEAALARHGKIYAGVSK